MPTIANLSDPITDAGKPVTNATARLTPRISGVASAQTAIRGSPEVRAPTAIVLDILRELEPALHDSHLACCRHALRPPSHPQCQLTMSRFPFHPVSYTHLT